MSVDLARLGARIRELREASGLTPAVTARRAGVSPAYIHSVENATPSGRTGRPSLPSVPVLRGIADAVGAKRSELLELAGYDDDAALDKAAELRSNGNAGIDMWNQTFISLHAKVDRLTPEAAAAIETLADQLLGEE